MILDDIPRFLLPISNKKGTKSPINGPDIYQGQGSLIKFIIYYSVDGQIKSDIGRLEFSDIATKPPETSITFV